MSTNPRGRPVRRGQPAGAGRWLTPVARHPWYLATAAIAVIALVVGGAALLIQGGGPSQPVASGCGLINCGASLPSPGISTQSHISKAHTSVSHPPAAPKQSASPRSQAPTTPAPVPATNVSVSLTSDRDRRDFDHFQDQVTLVNNGGSPVSGWTLRLTLPGDGIDSVENQDGWDGVPFDHWEYSGDTLTISADTDSETLGSGSPLNVSIHGRGNTASPTGCTFNGAACPVPAFDHQGPQQGQLSSQQGQPTQSQQFMQQAQQPTQGQQLSQPDQQPSQQDYRSWQDQRSWQQDLQSWQQDQRSWQGDYKRF
jgi:hypothetical protein